MHKCQLDVQHERRDNAKTIKNKNPRVGDHVIWTSWVLVAVSSLSVEKYNEPQINADCDLRSKGVASTAVGMNADLLNIGILSTLN